MATSRRFIIYGAGAMGGVAGAELFTHGNEVVLIARGEHYRVIAESGLRYITPDGETTLPIPVVDDPAKIDFRPDDVVIVAVKSQDTYSVTETLYRVAPQSIAVACLQNGVANEDLVSRFFPNVYAISVSSPAEFLLPGSVVSFASPVCGALRLGRYPHGTDAAAQEIGAALDATRYDAKVFPDVQRWKWAKLLDNLVNVVQALLDPEAGSAISAIGRGEGTGAVLGKRARDEAIRTYEAAGIDYVGLAEFKKGGSGVIAREVHGAERVGASMHQSLTRGLSSLETDYINGEIVRLGHLHGVPTPVNAFYQRISHEAVVNRIQPGSISEAEFLRRLADFEKAYPAN